MVQDFVWPWIWTKVENVERSNGHRRQRSKTDLFMATGSTAANECSAELSLNESVRDAVSRANHKGKLTWSGKKQ